MFWGGNFLSILERDFGSSLVTGHVLGQIFEGLEKGCLGLFLTKILPLDSGTQNWNESWHGTRPPGRVTVMAGVQAVAALAGDEHGHYEDDDFSSALLDEHFRLEKEYESQIERDVNALGLCQNGHVQIR